MQKPILFTLSLWNRIILMQGPDDAKVVGEDVFLEFSRSNDGKVRVANKKGLPEWADIPPPSHEQLIAQAESKKQTRIAEATTKIAPLQDAVDLEMQTEEEVTKLRIWKKYRVLLNRVDCSTAPDIAWPEPPK
ncbi:tail fiber assembly protein [Xenorhabdus siamensis]|uniref:tail fiber assembly protein n=1 Tax=Xenorhabdus siamensis TaxID=3136254 RepID=UPI0030F384E8